MEKQELLNRFKTEANNEYNDFVNNTSDDYGFSAMVIIAIVIMAIKSIKDQSTADILTLIFSFLAFGMYKRYVIKKDKIELIMTVVFGLVALAFFVRFLLVIF